MAGEKNKVRYNLKNVHYAKLTRDESGAVSYATPVPIAGGVNISFEAEGEITPFYADGMTYYRGVSNNGYTGDLEIALIPESFRTEILGDTLDTAKVLVENADAPINEFALLFEFDGDKKKIRHVFYDCVATRPTIEGATTEDKIEVQTEKLSLSATPLENGNVKAKTGDATTETTYQGWYSAVYVSGTAE